MNAIQFLVARSVKGVNKSNVAVVDNWVTPLPTRTRPRVPLVSPANDEGLQCPGKPSEKKIVTMLEKVVGQGNVIAKVS